ncbi:STAS domain-containing protein [Geothermobacter hydrogeniphilus]|uniref:STAS domain-containing protein n=1 Tax=Geothermobacter hydrogeniphilus TaxID=1969733 RepID=A0A1X0YDE3_9BACT|nr:STAS domain-containing protein [Geothermobacter hydrogeniphilus]ORJ63004.1 hypothetical protein B5V00_02840 [Geothermobacter hydrogeniphilus]
MSALKRLALLIQKHRDQLVDDWVALQQEALADKKRFISLSDLQHDAGDFFNVFEADLTAGEDAPLLDQTLLFLERLTNDRIERGFSVEQVTAAIFTLKKPLFRLLSEHLRDNPAEVLELTQASSDLLDQLGMHAVTRLVDIKEKLIRQQQSEMMELSTPTVKIWDGILALPLIGTLDSARTQSIMESLLDMIVATSSTVAILDITGVPTVDTMVAQHILKTVAAARLMGAECLISGIRPQIAQTMVHLGVGFQDVTTKATLAEALAHAFALRGLTVRKRERE